MFASVHRCFHLSFIHQVLAKHVNWPVRTGSAPSGFDHAQRAGSKQLPLTKLPFQSLPLPLNYLFTTDAKMLSLSPSIKICLILPDPSTSNSPIPTSRIYKTTMPPYLLKNAPWLPLPLTTHLSLPLQYLPRPKNDLSTQSLPNPDMDRLLTSPEDLIPPVESIKGAVMIARTDGKDLEHYDLFVLLEFISQALTFKTEDPYFEIKTELTATAFLYFWNFRTASLQARGKDFVGDRVFPGMQILRERSKARVAKMEEGSRRFDDLMERAVEESRGIYRLDSEALKVPIEEEGVSESDSEDEEGRVVRRVQRGPRFD